MKRAWREARSRLAGGVNSPVRAFKAVGGTPVFTAEAFGPYLYDVEGARYVDYCMSWGAILLGHASEISLEAIRRQCVKGTSYGTATEYETALAAAIQKAFPRMERIRFTSSGTEAVMSAIRLARGVTGRDQILKFEGCYHGHADSLLVKAGSGLATFGRADSAGVPQALANLTSVLPYNDTVALRAYFRTERPACAIVEPVAGNMGVVPGSREFLETLRSLCQKNGTLLIFDEVISGFRVGYGGAQHLLGIEPDITTLGKIIGGGLPVGAFGAKASIMRALSPEGGVYQAGTLSGNPLSMAAGRAVLDSLKPELYLKLDQNAKTLTDALAAAFRRRRVQVSIPRVGSMFTVFFSPRAPRNFSEVARCDKARFARFFRSMLAHGIYLPPSAFEACFVSAAHAPADFNRTAEAATSS